MRRIYFVCIFPDEMDRPRDILKLFSDEDMRNTILKLSVTESEADKTMTKLHQSEDRIEGTVELSDEQTEWFSWFRYPMPTASLLFDDHCL